MRLGHLLPLVAGTILMAGCLGDDGSGGNGSSPNPFDDNGTPPPTSPNFSLTVNQASGRLTVESVAEGADWNRLQMKAGKAIVFHKDAEARTSIGTEVAANTWTEITNVADTMTVGEYLDFCGGTKAAPATQSDVTVAIRDYDASTLKGDFMLASIAACN